MNLEIPQTASFAHTQSNSTHGTPSILTGRGVLGTKPTFNSGCGWFHHWRSNLVHCKLSRGWEGYEVDDTKKFWVQRSTNHQWSIEFQWNAAEPNFKTVTWLQYKNVKSSSATDGWTEVTAISYLYTKAGMQLASKITSHMLIMSRRKLASDAV